MTARCTWTCACTCTRAGMLEPGHVCCIDYCMARCAALATGERRRRALGRGSGVYVGSSNIYMWTMSDHHDETKPPAPWHPGCTAWVPPHPRRRRVVASPSLQYRIRYTTEILYLYFGTLDAPDRTGREHETPRSHRTTRSDESRDGEFRETGPESQSGVPSAETGPTETRIGSSDHHEI